MKNSTVMIVEDDELVRAEVAEFLTDKSYTVIIVDDVSVLEKSNSNGLPKIALIGLKLPDMRGFDVANRLKSTADVPIIFMSSGVSTDGMIAGLKTYADDFVVKPVNLHELDARIQMVSSRLPSLDFTGEPVVRVDKFLSIDFANRRIFVAGQTVRLTPTESILLHVLLRNAPRVVENKTLIARVWPMESIFEDTLRVHMHRLRRKMELDSHHPQYIRTERGIGYRFAQRPPDAF